MPRKLPTLLALPASLVISLQADAGALGIPASQIGAILLSDALERARARRYAPYHLPEGYGWDAYGNAYKAGEAASEGSTPVIAIRRARKAAR